MTAEVEFLYKTFFKKRDRMRQLANMIVVSGKYFETSCFGGTIREFDKRIFINSKDGCLDLMKEDFFRLEEMIK